MLPVSQLSPLTAAHVNPTTEDIISSACTFAMWQQSSGNGNAAILTCDKLQLYFMQRQQTTKQQHGSTSGSNGAVQATGAPAGSHHGGVPPSTTPMAPQSHRQPSPPQSTAPSTDGLSLHANAKRGLVRQLQAPEPREERREEVVAAIVQAFGSGVVSPSQRLPAPTDTFGASRSRSVHTHDGEAAATSSVARRGLLDGEDQLEVVGPPSAVAAHVDAAAHTAEVARPLQSPEMAGSSRVRSAALDAPPADATPSLVGSGRCASRPDSGRADDNDAHHSNDHVANNSVGRGRGSVDSSVHPLDVSAIPIYLEDGMDVFTSQRSFNDAPQSTPSSRSSSNPSRDVVVSTEILSKRPREETSSRSSRSSSSGSSRRRRRVDDAPNEDCREKSHQHETMPMGTVASAPSAAAASAADRCRSGVDSSDDAPVTPPTRSPSIPRRNKGLLATPQHAPPQSELRRVVEDDEEATDAPSGTPVVVAPAAGPPQSSTDSAHAAVVEGPSLNASAPLPSSASHVHVPVPRRQPVLNTQRRALRSHKPVGVVSSMFTAPTHVPPAGRQDAAGGQHAPRRAPTSRPTSPPPAAQSKQNNTSTGSAHGPPHQKKKYQPPTAGK